MDDEIIRILVATDNHIGFLEKDSIRGNDPLAAFEEVLATGRKLKVDMILFAGDMFHENKPSRHAIYGSMELLRKYCLGDSEVYTEILSEQREAFKSSQGVVNYENPFQAISLPVYAIHGNHDDPSRECGQSSESLAALDLLAVSNLLNYFGKADQVDDVEINPILIRKGDTYIALYGLGAVRDERLNRMWNLRKVKFVRPSIEQGRDRFFNIFLLHQNRDYGRGSKNCIHESMIPEWMDLVIWGNEHEAIPRLVESLVGTYRIFQPGSTVATSLVEGESSSHPKGMGFLEVRSTKEFRMKAIPLKQIRPFVYREISLSDFPPTELQPTDLNVEEKIRVLLSKVVEDMIKEAREQSPLLSAALSSSSSSSSSSSESTSLNQKYSIKSPELVLVRLKVEHTGYPTIHPQRFGALFVGKVANPNDLIIFSRKKTAEVGTNSRSAKDMINDREELMQRLLDDEDNINKIKIEDLVGETLISNNKNLQLLPDSEMAKALNDFVLRRFTNAIVDTVDEALEHVQRELFADVNATAALGSTNKAIIDAASRVKRAAEESVRKGQQAFPVTNKVPRRPVVLDKDSDEDDGGANDDEDGEEAVAPKGRGRGRGKAAATPTAAATGRGGGRGSRGGKGATAKTSATAGTGRGRGRKKKSDSSDEEDTDAMESSAAEEEDNISVFDDASDHNDNDDNDDDQIFNRGRKGTSKKPTSKAAEKAKKSSSAAATSSKSAPRKSTKRKQADVDMDDAVNDNDLDVVEIIEDSDQDNDNDNYRPPAKTARQTAAASAAAKSSAAKSSAASSNSSSRGGKLDVIATSSPVRAATIRPAVPEAPSLTQRLTQSGATATAALKLSGDVKSQQPKLTQSKKSSLMSGW